MLLEHHQRSSGELPLLDAPRGSVAASRPRSLARRAAPRWVRTYSAALVVFEALAAAAAGAAVVFTRPGGVDASSNLFWSALVLVVAWPLLLGITGAHSERVFGTGSDEYRRGGRARFLLLAVPRLVFHPVGLELSPALVVLAMPALVIVAAVGRYAARCCLRRLRSVGRCTKRVVVVGRGGAVLELVDRLQRENYAGLKVVA